MHMSQGLVSGSAVSPARSSETPILSPELLKSTPCTPLRRAPQTQIMTSVSPQLPLGQVVCAAPPPIKRCQMHNLTCAINTPLVLPVW